MAFNSFDGFDEMLRVLTELLDVAQHIHGELDISSYSGSLYEIHDRLRELNNSIEGLDTRLASIESDISNLNLSSTL